MPHNKPHLSHRSGWLRAAVLGANDGIISTASLLVGVASAQVSNEALIITGLVAICSGAFSMAAGEYVSVSSQQDLENADLQMEQESIAQDYQSEVDELAQIYQRRGVSSHLASQVAQELMATNALDAHARDDIGIQSTNLSNPILAAFSSALAFLIGGGLPLLPALLANQHTVPVLFVCSVLSLALLGGISAKLGNASVFKASIRVSVWGIAAMSVSALIGHWISH